MAAQLQAELSSAHEGRASFASGLKCRACARVAMPVAAHTCVSQPPLKQGSPGCAGVLGAMSLWRIGFSLYYEHWTNSMFSGHWLGGEVWCSPHHLCSPLLPEMCPHAAVQSG